MEELRAFVSGRVQGVMFRDFTQRKARALRLSGWVKNLSDGRVEVLAQGTRADLETLLAFLKKGSFFSRVDRVEEHWTQAGLPEEGFRIVF